MGFQTIACLKPTLGRGCRLELRKFPIFNTTASSVCSSRELLSCTDELASGEFHSQPTRTAAEPLWQCLRRPMAEHRCALCRRKVRNGYCHPSVPTSEWVALVWLAAALHCADLDTRSRQLRYFELQVERARGERRHKQQRLQPTHRPAGRRTKQSLLATPSASLGSAETSTARS